METGITADVITALIDQMKNMAVPRPGYSVETFMGDMVTSVLERCCLDCNCFTNKEVIMMGDFNVDYSQLHSHTNPLRISLKHYIQAQYHSMLP